MNLLSKMIGDRKGWKQMEARADALPQDYRVVYGAMKSYLFRFASGDGRDVVDLLEGVLARFEAGAAEGRRALDVTGEDVAAYCDALLGERAHPMERYLAKWRNDLNRDVQARL